MTRKITVEHHRQKHLEHEAQFKVGASDSEDEDDPALSSAPRATSAANGSVKGIKEEAAGDEDSEESKEQLAEMEDLTHRKKFMKNFGKESRHNVISRKDNLMLSPDKPVLPEEHVSDPLSPYDSPPF